MDENCYEQMKARPKRPVNDMQETTSAEHVSFVFYIQSQVQTKAKHMGMFQEHKSIAF
jgi:hypothetical protein